MGTIFVFSIFLQALLYATCSGEACSGDWTTVNTKYTIVNYGGDLYVHVTCNNKTFKVDGGNTIKCVNGQLPTYLPQCVPSKGTCPPLKAPILGSMRCDATTPEVGSSCTFECQSSHFLKGSRTRFCSEDLRWTGYQSHCFSKTGTCPHLKGLVYGSMTCNATTREVGSVCKFECQSTHYLKGSITRICSENLRWTGSQTRCSSKPECQSPPPLHQGTVIGCSPSRRPKYGDKCSFRCNEGFQMEGPSHLTCRLNGLLTDNAGRQSFPRCRRTLPVHSTTPAPPSNEGHGTRLYSVFQRSCQVHNGYCTHYCHQEQTGIRCSCGRGYELSGDGRNCIETLPVHSTSDASPSNEGHRTRLYSVHQRSCQVHNGNCAHYCHQEQTGIRCSCSKGYELSGDGRICMDINECMNDYLNMCAHTCVNTIGSYSCSCRPGFVSSDGFRCEGCRINSYRGRTDVSCRDCPADSHTDGYEKTSIDDCICNLGFTGNPGQGIPCKDIDECADGDNFGCSHMCINTPGSAHCACPLGYQLKEDEKTCTDIDECSIKNGGCDGICHNTVGNFTCSCPEGYVASPKDRYTCDDVDECSEGNGGCSDKCVNFRGGFHCFCSEGYHLHPDGKTCISVYCPRVFVPHHSTLRCKNSTDSDKVTFRPGEMSQDEEFAVGATCRVKCDKGYDIRDSHPLIVCQNDGKWNASLPECRALQCPPLTPPPNGDVYPASCQEGPTAVKQKCVFTCHSGYRITGQEVLTCRNNLTWKKKEKPTKCVPETEVSISCPDDDITIELMPHEGWAEIQLNSPRTTLEAGPIQISPDWCSLDGPSSFPVGETEVTFSVTKDNNTAECSISVIVLDKHPPVFRDCPDTVFMTSSMAGTAVNWKEPVADDNVGIVSVSKNLEPNATLVPGLHSVEYVARDLSGNVGQCIFLINVTAVGCKDLAAPENGEANCMEWMFGKICQPTCFENFTRPPELFACDESGTWEPTNFISPCLPECLQGETWSPELEKCVKIP